MFFVLLSRVLASLEFINERVITVRLAEIDRESTARDPSQTRRTEGSDAC
jgi:hypothetical protein